MRISVIAAALALLLGGCSSTYEINTSADAMKHLEKKNGTIHLALGGAIKAGEFHVSGDSLSYIDKRNDSSASKHLREIAIVKRTNHSAGFGRGLLVGGGGALIATSILAGIDSEKERSNPEPSGSAGAMRDMFIVATTLFGGIVGSLVGASIGREESYVFHVVPLDTDSGAATAPAVAEPVQTTDSVVTEDPFDVRKAFTIGIDLGDALSSTRGSFNDRPGFNVRYTTVIAVKRKLNSYLGLGVELDFSLVSDYRLNLVRDYAWSSLNFTRYVLDERHRLSSVDIAVMPGYYYAAGEHTLLGVYAGAGFGFGAGSRRVNVRSETFVQGASPIGLSGISDLYDTEQRIRTVGCGMIGASMYYKRIMIDLRYKYSDMTDGWTYNNVNFHIGYVL